MRKLIENVIQWARDRNIIEGSTSIKQLDKTSEEFNELQRAVAAFFLARELCLWNVEEDSYSAIRDAYGDVLVTLIISAHQLGIDLEDALAAAYDEIKDRRGVLRNGVFVKESDL